MAAATFTICKRKRKSMADFYVALGFGGGIWDIAAYSQAQPDRHYYTTVLAASDTTSGIVIELHLSLWLGIFRQANPKSPTSVEWQVEFFSTLFSVVVGLHTHAGSISYSAWHYACSSRYYNGTRYGTLISTTTVAFEARAAGACQNYRLVL